MHFPNEEKGWNKEIGNIIIKDIRWVKKEIPIHDIRVNFPKATVMGRK
ncbi:hypothetical protein [Anaerobacillus arseniciselenatis]|nr:hypothetical protein [Anaerobacillus arseniciselenatis]